MSEDYLAQQQPTLTWNSVRGVWEKAGMANLLCEHWEPFSETWPTSGTMRNGRVFELPTPAHRIIVSEFSSLPTPTTSDRTGAAKSEIDEGNPHDRLKVAVQLLRSPTASQGEGGALGEEEARKRGNTVGIRDQAMDLAALNLLPTTRAQHGADRNNKIYARDPKQPQNLENALSVTLMPTPNTMDHLPARTAEQKAANKGKGGYANVRETVVNDLLPTPVASEGTKAPAQQTSEVKGKTGQVWLSNVAKDMEPALPTPTASDWKGANHSGSGSASSRGISTVVQQTHWGKFEPAIRRWEETLGRPAPAPTRPDGKDGAHRLSPEFTEFMMGVPEGWITDCGLTRNEELKACGNGVVPQQAALALRVLLEGIPLPAGGGK